MPLAKANAKVCASWVGKRPLAVLAATAAATTLLGLLMPLAKANADAHPSQQLILDYCAALALDGLWWFGVHW
jgi:hypothetical protein